jgi:outer membrane receptor protein involved in Fe transport
MRSFVRALVVVVACASPAIAGTEDEDLSGLSIEELLELSVSVGSLEASPIVRSPSTVTVITRDMIEAYGFRTVVEALDVIAGYSTVRTYSMRSVPTFRGLLNFHYANKVLLLVNGVPTWSAVTGHTNLERVGIESVERIEILNGPASVLYGTNAYAGAINIVLRTADGEGRGAHGSVGSRGGFSGGGEMWTTRRGWSLFAGFETYDDGDAPPYRFVDEDGIPGWVTDFARGGDASVLARYGGHQLLLNAFRHEYMRFGSTPTYADGAGHDQRHRGLLAAYRYRRALGDRVTTSSGVSWDDNVRNFDRSEDGQLRTNDHGWRLGGTLDARVDVRDDVFVEAGAAYDYRKAEEYRNYEVRNDVTVSDNNMRDRSVWEASLFGQVGYSGRRLNALVGSRLTDNQGFGLNVASRSTVSYAFAENHAVKVVVGQAFRAPSLFELYFTTDTGTVFGNPALEPETSTSGELVYVGVTGDLLTQATAYVARYDSIIYRTLVDGVNTYSNGAPFDAVGSELQLTYRAGRATDAFASVRYLERIGAAPMDEGYDVLRFEPAVTGDVGVSRAIGAWRVSGLAHYRSAVDGPLARIGYTWTLDAGVGYRFELAGADAEVRLDGRNLTDQLVEIPEYVRRDTVNAIPADLHGRQAFLAVRWAM